MCGHGAVKNINPMSGFQRNMVIEISRLILWHGIYRKKNPAQRRDLILSISFIFRSPLRCQGDHKTGSNYYTQER